MAKDTIGPMTLSIRKTLGGVVGTPPPQPVQPQGGIDEEARRRQPKSQGCRVIISAKGAQLAAAADPEETVPQRESEPGTPLTYTKMGELDYE